MSQQELHSNAKMKNKDIKKEKSFIETFLFLSRGDRIRTCDHLVPNQARYRTALHPAHSSLRHLLSIALSIISELRVQRYYIFSIPPNFSLIFFKKICILMQNGWDTDKNKGNPYLELPLYLIIYSSG